MAPSKRDNIRHVLIPLLERAKVADDTGSQMHQSLDAAISHLNKHSLRYAIAPAPEQPPGATSVSKGFVDLALREIEDFNSEGVSAICSVTEAQWKSHGIMNYWHQGHSRGRFFFRGEHQSKWRLVSSAGRRGLVPDKSNPLSVTSDEIAELRRFQAMVQMDRSLSADVFPDGRLLCLESSDWWALMQHYHSGTRMVDITSSIFCALFFACADWDGSIDEEGDGALYLFPKVPGRSAEVHPDFIDGHNVGPTDQLHPTIDQYFTVDNHSSNVRFRESFYRNDRLLAQDGYFLWQPNFDQPLNVHSEFKFRVPGAKKLHILRELYSIGYTAQRIVRGKKGATAHRNVCKMIGVND